MSSFATKAGEAMASRYLEEGSAGIVRGDCLYKAEDIQRITCGQPHKIPFSMLIKVCETLGPLYKDNRMNSKIISKPRRRGLSPPPLPPEEVLKDILDELTGVQGRVNKIEMMIIGLLNQKNESKETIKPC